MTEDEFNGLIERYQRGLATDEERAMVDAWYESIQHDDGDFTWNTKDEDLQFQAIQNRIKADERPDRVVPLYASGWLKIAAAVLILMSSSYVLWYKMIRNETMTLTAMTGYTQKTILSDGTLVWLKGNSTLQYPERFDGQQRMVYLKGEALFEVAKDPLHPFVIQCGNLSAKVLGTSFNIRANDADIELTVLTGKVELFAGKEINRVVVLPNQKVLYDGLPPKAKVPVAEAEKVKLIHGTEYDMNFSNTPVADIIGRIEKKFDKKVTVDNASLRQCMITADFTDQSLENTLRMVSYILGFEYEVNSYTVTIRGGGCD
ncbi:MAG: FecR domain-containing protein [Chryseosolibacter sp.]